MFKFLKRFIALHHQEELWYMEHDNKTAITKTGTPGVKSFPVL